MKTKICYVLCCFFLSPIFGQGNIDNFKEKFTLPIEVKETSGLLFFNDKIITHNDSGYAANLYEIDSLSGLITRTVKLLTQLILIGKI
ncbi:hypothetical protein [Lutibacter sp. Hel_I_33_5]|uniref:hypothetical protein n=1 Tax=Lutibacter sp. Hel_I_33_5 TaxID=1566289 RepID=UPI0011A17E18|nr:hypothetical protein [Lutibacter sp. Hel_I_33_5]